MLVSLHVRNLALIEETEVFFQPGLNILTGETGAGKSVILGSVALALGAKALAQRTGGRRDDITIIAAKIFLRDENEK